VVRRTDRHVRFLQQLVNEYEVSRLFTHPALRRSIDMKENRTLLRRVTEAGLIMELFDGSPVDALPPMGVVSLLDCFLQVSNGLAALHAMGYVHCDLKPNNILVGPNGDVKVIDYGQACRIGTVKERIQGTPDYISPEQVRREPVTHRTDVFNFGATMYWAATREVIPTLFNLKKGDNSFLLDQRIPSPRDANPRIPETLSNLIMECVRTNPAKRPDDMPEVARRLELIRLSVTRSGMTRPLAISA
jgi:serine/threonine-protein kinase